MSTANKAHHNGRAALTENLLNMKPIEVKFPSAKISDYYAQNVFTIDTMRKHLSGEAYSNVILAIDTGAKIERDIAEQVAASMKSWAMEKGATHYTHWFQPLTGATAEKHDAFFTPIDSSRGIEKFNAEALVQQEPDASSFPSGGIRSTFEARGYTAWDPSSPAFIMEIGSGKTLCIPTIFVSYSGEALDYKTPLLKSQHFLETAAVPVCNYFDRNVTKVIPTLGWEQEYFLIDAGLFQSRPDLVMTGRTVFGHAPAKGQQLEDHYFGSIPERIYAFMLDLETEAAKLGIPLKTRHNEVAPCQFECAPTFEEVNIAVDHNQLIMDLMDRIARRHNLRVLLHEKPFAGINGSGKHNNWSMATDTGKNLLSPGKTPKTNLQFLTFFINTIKAVHDHADLLRAAIASAANDFRLGANEAPPAIISVFAGTHLTDVLNDIESRVKKGELSEHDKTVLKLDIHNKIPDLLMDNTDRNRTSPFAFTGNKFEFRAVGSSQNCSWPMTILNIIVGNQLVEFKKEVDALIDKKEEKESAIWHILRKYISSSKNILFDGNNYSEEWAQEAKKRGLSNIKTTPPALDVLVNKESMNLFEASKVMNEKEIHARYEVNLENYIKKVQIESRIIGELALTQIIPAAVHYQNSLIENVEGMKFIGYKKEHYGTLLELIEDISAYTAAVKENVDAMLEERKKANNLDDTRKKAFAYCDKVKPYFDLIREPVDKLEQIVDDKMWPLAKYRELLFLR